MTIAISPPLTLEDVTNGPALRTIELIHLAADEDRSDAPWTANTVDSAGIDMNYYPHFIADELRRVVNYYQGHEFAGFIEVRNSSPSQSPVSRFTVANRHVETVAPHLVWPDGPMAVDSVPEEWLQAAFDAIGRSGTDDGDGQVRHAVAALLPLMRARISAEVEAYAESIGWYEAGGVWAEALDVIRQKPWTRRGGVR